jgi:1-acyl-sn-glycerol-3-phosphate acyltransferase
LSARPSDRGPVAWLARRAKVGSPGEPRPWVLGLLRWVVTPLVRLLWPARLVGWERVPADRAALIVANHSGSGVVDVFALAVALLERPGPLPRLTGMAHPAAFHLPIVGRFLRDVGAIPATYEHAQAALAQGVHVLVYPGGDHDAFRPVWQAADVDFAGRQGFLRLARRAGVPVVPLGYRGTAFSNPVLWRSGLLPRLALLPRLLGLKRLPILVPWLAGLAAILLTALPEHPLAAALLAWVWVSFFWVGMALPWVPWPVQMTIGEPIAPEDLFGTRDEAAPLDAAYARVVTQVEAAVRAPDDRAPSRPWLRAAALWSALVVFLVAVPAPRHYFAGGDHGACIYGLGYPYPAGQWRHACPETRVAPGVSVHAAAIANVLVATVLAVVTLGWHLALLARVPSPTLPRACARIAGYALWPFTVGLLLIDAVDPLAYEIRLPLDLGPRVATAAFVAVLMVLAHTRTPWVDSGHVPPGT